MAKKFEIERKFLIKNISDSELAELSSSILHISQGYLSRRKESTVRVRICNEKAFITVKGITTGAKREEYEYLIPVDDARNMLQLCEGEPLVKDRYIIPWNELTLEIDIFKGKHEGLRLCEIELPSEDYPLILPPFIDKEVTDDPSYFNSNLK